MSRGAILRLHREWLAWTCCDATDECLVRALVNRASPWGLAGFDVVELVLLQISALDTWTAVAAKGSKLGMWISSAFRHPGIPRASIHATGKRRVYLGILGNSVPKCALECNEKYVKPQRPRHVVKFELARLGD